MKAKAYEKLSFAEQVSVHLSGNAIGPADFRSSDGYPFQDVWDYGNDVRLIVEDEEAREVRVILFTESRVIEDEAIFRGVPVTRVAAYLQGVYR